MRLIKVAETAKLRHENRSEIEEEKKGKKEFAENAK